MAIGPSDDVISAIQERGKRAVDKQRNGRPRFSFPDISVSPATRDSLFNALMGVSAGAEAGANAGDPVIGALTGFGAGLKAPTAADFREKRLDQLSVDEVSPDLVQRYPELSGVPLGVVNKIAPLLQREDAFARELLLIRARGEEGLKTREVTESAAKRIPAPTILNLNEGKNVGRLLPEVAEAIEANLSIFGPVSGRARGMNPYDARAQTVDARMRTASQSFGRFMEGGVLRKEDEEKYRKMFPQLSDTPEVAKNKLQIVARQLAQKFNDDRQTLGSSGYDVSGVGSLDVPDSIFSAGGVVRMIAPNGEEFEIPAKNVDAAIKRGAKRR